MANTTQKIKSVILSEHTQRVSALLRFNGERRKVSAKVEQDRVH